MAQTLTLTEWGAYLEQPSTIAASPLAMELQTVEFTTDDILDAEVPTDSEVSRYREGKPPIPADAWYTDRSSRGREAKWVAIGVQPAIDHVCYDRDIGRSSQWAEL